MLPKLLTNTMQFWHNINEGMISNWENWQNHRMDKIGRDLLRSPNPTPSAQATCKSRLCRTMSSQLLNSSQMETLHMAFLGNLFQSLVTLKLRSIFLSSDWISWFSICPTASCLVRGHYSLLLHFLPSGIYTHWLDPPESLLLSRLNSSSFLSLSS